MELQVKYNINKIILGTKKQMVCYSVPKDPKIGDLLELYLDKALILKSPIIKFYNIFICSSFAYIHDTDEMFYMDSKFAKLEGFYTWSEFIKCIEEIYELPFIGQIYYWQGN